MNKYSYIALIIAVIVGVLVGGFFQSNRSEKELNQLKEKQRLEIAKQISKHEQSVEEFKEIIMEQELELVSADEELEKLQLSLKASKAATAKAREEVKKLSAKGKEKWLVSRYDSLSKVESDSSVVLSDPVAGGVIDELILKDGLVDEVKIQDSTITVYQYKDSTYQEIIATHEQKDVEQDSIISKQDQINTSLVKDNNDLERQNRIQRIKTVGIKLLAIGEGILIILLIL